MTRRRLLAVAMALVLGAAGVAAKEKRPAGDPLVGADAWAVAETALPDLEGRERRVSDWKGRTILLNFWAPWCPPCRAEVPRLIRHQKEYGPRGLQVVGVGLDDPDRLAEFARRHGIDYPILAAGEGDAAALARWGMDRRQVPYTVVIGPEGRVYYSEFGVFPDAAFEALVEPLLETK